MRTRAALKPDTRPNPLKTQLPSRFPLAAMVIATAMAANATDARFYRIAGPVSGGIGITSFTADGHITWTNAEPGKSCIVQKAGTPSGTWTDLLSMHVPGQSITVKLFDREAPAGMVPIPAGTFRMGNVYPNLDVNAEGWTTAEHPPHDVSVSAFYMDETEVTKELWTTVYQWALANGYSITNVGVGKGPDHPVHTVSWYEVVKWCNARSEMEGRPPVYYTDSTHTMVHRSGQDNLTNVCVKWNAIGYRLPTEAEWERAARGGLSGVRFPWGDTITQTNANYLSYWVSTYPRYAYDLNPTSGHHPTYDDGTYFSGGYYTNPVRDFPPNAYGLYGIVGNVQEWCWDVFTSNYYSTSPTTDPHGPATGTAGRAYRGGSWNGTPAPCRLSSRSNFLPRTADRITGFRTVITAVAP